MRNEELNRLRDLLVGPERDAVARLEARLDDASQRTRDVSDVLVEAISQRNARDNALHRSLVPLIRTTFETAAREEPRQLAAALFPVILPALFRAARTAVSRAGEAVDGFLSRNFTPSGLRARAAAARAGLPLTEHLIRQRLVYRVEHVLLIHQRDGVVLQQLVPAEGPVPGGPDPAAILAAVEQAARDVFRSPAPGDGDTLTVGDHTVWIERGRLCLVAAVVRGTAPDSYRTLLRSVVAGVEARFAHQLRLFSLESSPFEPARDLLRDAFRQELREAVTPRFLRHRLVFALLLTALFAAGMLWSIARLAERSRWQRLLAALDHEPGFVVTTAERRAGHYFLRGLRDPLARDPSDLLRQAEVAPGAVNMHWDTFQSGDPAFIQDRARRLLQPPPGVTLSLNGGTLVASGTAPHAWILQARRLARGLPGVLDYADDQLVNLDRQEIEEVNTRLEGIFLTFADGTDVGPQQDNNIRGSLDLITRIAALAEKSGLTVVFEITGYADPGDLTGPNATLGRTRAELVRNYLADRMPPETQFRVVDGSALFARGPARRDVTLTRCVVFRALVSEPATP